LARQQTKRMRGGGIAPRIHWYRALSYSVQVLDGICKNVELSEIEENGAEPFP
jgi:hypothetical protein